MQNVVDFGTSLQKINMTKSVFSPPPSSVSIFFGDREVFYISHLQLHVVASYCVYKVTFVFVLLMCALLHL